MNNNRYAALFSTADDLEAEASLDADLEEARRAAGLLAGPDPLLAVAALLAAAAEALKQGVQPWGLLEAADRQIGDLRLEHECEAWAGVRVWTNEICALEFLWAQERLLRDGCRRLRDRALAEREALAKAESTTLAKAG